MRIRISHASCVKMAESEQGTSSSTSSRGNPVESATSSTCHTDSEGTDSALSLLQRLRSPLPSELARKRAIKTNPPVGAKRGKGRCSATPKTVSVGDRLKAYPEENFVSSNNRLFCSVCREVVALKKSVIELHISSQKHKRGKERLGTNVAREKSICESLKAYDVIVHPVGENLPDEVSVYTPGESRPDTS